MEVADPPRTQARAAGVPLRARYRVVQLLHDACGLRPRLVGKGTTLGGSSSKRAIPFVHTGAGNAGVVPAAIDALLASLGEDRVDSEERDLGTCSRLVGLPLTLVTRATAIAVLQRLMTTRGSPARWVCFLNSHNFNHAMLDRHCSQALQGASAVFPDGIAIRTAARLCGLHVPENLPGTDLVPAMLESGSGRCFLIGDTLEHVERAAHALERRFPAWSVVGFSSGYFRSEDEERRVIGLVNRAEPDLLLVGMGTPLQERFVGLYAGELRVPLCICVGGLFGYWSRKLIRAPRTVRALGLEWLWILVQQPRKLRRYTIGTARFFLTVWRQRKHVATRWRAAP